MKCAVILPNLLVGPRPDDPEDFEFLKSRSVTAILSLLTSEDLAQLGEHWEESQARSAKLQFRNVPIADFDDLDLTRKLPACVEALEELLKAGEVVYLHCTAGVTRSPTVAAAYLHWRLKRPLSEALNHLHKARNCYPRGDLIELALGRGP